MEIGFTPQAEGHDFSQRPDHPSFGYPILILDTLTCGDFTIEKIGTGYSVITKISILDTLFVNLANPLLEVFIV